MLRIRIIAVPDGKAPDGHRQALLGLEIPLPKDAKSGEPTYTVPVPDIITALKRDGKLVAAKWYEESLKLVKAVAPAKDEALVTEKANDNLEAASEEGRDTAPENDEGAAPLPQAVDETTESVASVIVQTMTFTFGKTCTLLY